VSETNSVLLHPPSTFSTRILTENEGVVSISDWSSSLRPVRLYANSRGHHSPHQLSNESNGLAFVRWCTPPQSGDFDPENRLWALQAPVWVSNESTFQAWGG